MLKINNLHVSVADKPILNGSTLDVPAGEGLAIMGPDGAIAWYAVSEGDRS